MVTAHVERDDDGWVATVSPNVFTQAESLDQLRPRVAEVWLLMTGEAIDPEAIELDFT